MNKFRSFAMSSALTLLMDSLAPGGQAFAAAASPTVSVHYVQVEGVKVFYREAGDPAAPTVLLLHGYPTSSLMYRNLIPLLADRYHVIAPDLPGFGFTEVPADAHYTYSFDHLAETMQAFTETLGLNKFAMEVFDYGAPVGWRMAVAHPERITAIITQNGNAYAEGLASAWNPIQTYWQHPTPENRAALRDFLKPDSIKWQYTHGVPDHSVVDPASYTVDSALFARPGNDDIQLDLFLDYANNVKQYPAYQAYFKKWQPPLLAVWGKNDPFFSPAGALAFKKDIPGAEIHFYDTGHFALETNGPEIAAQIHAFLDRTVGAKPQ
ncbi:alpha/beta hydrolase [Dyella solisilvae]|uniref:Alpha/beta hydrolase n=1 Tax=Dyella solisilvae TaxID=1920168 RepID=A0A370K3D9_9GAMM|nr:alpha/beta hydrolase [Dyella solisilvae]RDI97152.1 alpha/beta hydrolase [Dyella solisilvae]